MCLDCIVFRAGAPPVRVDDRGQLASALRLTLAELPNHDDVDLGEGPNNCLCNVDMDRLARRIGWQSSRHDWSAWELRETEEPPAHD